MIADPGEARGIGALTKQAADEIETFAPCVTGVRGHLDDGTGRLQSFQERFGDMAQTQDIDPHHRLAVVAPRQTGNVDEAMQRPVDCRERRIDGRGTGEIEAMEFIDAGAVTFGIESNDPGAAFAQQRGRRLADSGTGSGHHDGPCHAFIRTGV